MKGQGRRVKPYSDWLTLHQGDCREVLAALEPESVNCVVTSPPYWGLRDYGVDGQLGLEPTPEQYVENLVNVFRDVRRVLRDDGVVFLNLGDSYASQGGQRRYGSYDGATGRGEQPAERRGLPYGTSRTAPGGYQDDGYPSFRLCGACADALGVRSPGIDGPLAHGQRPSQRESSPASTESERGHLDSSDSTSPDCRPAAATSDREQTACLVDAQPPSSLVSMRPQSSPLLPADCHQLDSPSSVPPSPRSSSGDAQAFVHTSDAGEARTDYKADSEGLFEEQGPNIRRTGEYCSRCAPYLDFTTASLKPKDLVGIPWMVAFALRADGWWLRSDIIWSKSNPMPESVQDRPTRAHEYIFLLTKQSRYWYDAAAIREPGKDPQDDIRRMRQQHNGNKSVATAERWAAHGQATGHGRRHAGFNDRWDAMEKSGEQINGANKRSVWTVATQPFPGAHFATFPEALVKPCILAGCPEGGTVLDPFAGSGTVGVVARKAGRKAVLIELSADYCGIIEERIGSQTVMQL